MFWTIVFAVVMGMFIFKALDSVLDLIFKIKRDDVHSRQVEELLDLQHSIQQQLFDLEDAIHPKEYTEVMVEK